MRCEVDTPRLDAVLRLLTDAGLRGLTSQPPTLEELFLRHYSDDLARAKGNGGDGAGAVPEQTARTAQETR